MVSSFEYLNVPVKIGVIVIGVFCVMQIIGEILEFKGKAVPELLKVRKFFARRKKEKEETAQTLKEVRQLLGDVSPRYSEGNTTKLDSWMKWVNDRAVVYDESIVGITQTLSDVTRALDANTKLTEEMFVQSSRDRIIDFSYKAANNSIPVSREEFNRIFKVYDKYEKFLEEHGMTNGEIDIVYSIIRESYEKRMKKHSFTEDIRGN